MTKIFPCKLIIWLQSLDILNVKRIQTEVMHSSSHCCLGNTMTTGNSSDASNRTALYHFQYVILHLGSVLLSWSSTLSLWNSTSLCDSLVHTAEHSPIWHSTITKLLSVLFNCCSRVTITTAIHVYNVSILLILKCSHWTPSLFFCTIKQNRTVCNNWLSNLTTYDTHSHSELTEYVFLWLHVTVKRFTIEHLFIGVFWTKITQEHVFSLQISCCKTPCWSTDKTNNRLKFKAQDS
jgi:hypothetical protein